MNTTERLIDVLRDLITLRASDLILKRRDVENDYFLIKAKRVIEEVEKEVKP